MSSLPCIPPPKEVSCLSGNVFIYLSTATQLQLNLLYLSWLISASAQHPHIYMASLSCALNCHGSTAPCGNEEPAGKKPNRFSVKISASAQHPHIYMASLSCALNCHGSTAPCGNEEPAGKKPNRFSVKVNGTSTSVVSSKIKLDAGQGQAAGFAAPALAPVAPAMDTAADVGVDSGPSSGRQGIPTRKQTSDPFRQGFNIDGGVGYRQIIVIRSYEVGADKTATIESILNLLQETALNHVWMSGLLGDGFGATHGMIRNKLIWVVTRMQVEVESYPIWGEVVEVDTWVGASGKNGMRRDWLIRSHSTGATFARATSTWVMMNRETRRLSKMPEEVREEISPWFVDKYAIQEEAPEKIMKLGDSAKYMDSDLKPKRSDLDMNHHVNNVKYVRWMLETIPDQFLENHQLCGITLEYRKECGSSDVVQSLCDPDEDSILEEESINLIRGLSLAPEIIEGNGLLLSFDRWPLWYTHLLQIKGDQKNEEIVRGRTTWKRRLPLPFCATQF
ncbi:hypothetical protein Taro_042707 [Colocasia esculenta]|uniref:Acyl-[acyl-carrier-protein] hydrolase n=1 Tax=Colocasia esculenta TaxID=4460 RepID=A0A843WPK9_COLES|nr:hypothetical protein [Colocasia esculenta]